MAELSTARLADPRIYPTQDVPSDLTAIPRMGPVDYFDPDFWNNDLTLAEWIEYTEKGVYVALPDEKFCGSWDRISLWKNLGTKHFMARFGTEVLRQYNMPTEAQHENYKNNKLSEEDDDEDEDEDDESSEEEEGGAPGGSGAHMVTD